MRKSQSVGRTLISSENQHATLVAFTVNPNQSKSEIPRSNPGNCFLRNEEMSSNVVISRKSSIIHCHITTLQILTLVFENNDNCTTEIMSVMSLEVCERNTNYSAASAFGNVDSSCFVRFNYVTCLHLSLRVSGWRWGNYLYLVVWHSCGWLNTWQIRGFNISFIPSESRITTDSKLH